VVGILKKKKKKKKREEKENARWTSGMTRSALQKSIPKNNLTFRSKLLTWRVRAGN
jgi:hypothetical protein